MSTSGFSDKRILAVAVLLIGAAGLWGCDRWSSDEAAEVPATAAAASPAQPAQPVAKADTALETDKPSALDIDGDGQADSVRIARVGHYVVDDPIAVKAGNGAVALPEVDWNQDAVVVKLASGAEKAVNFPNVRTVAPMRIGSEVEMRARGLGCTIPASGQALLAEAEEGNMVIHRGKDGLVAEACGE